MKLSAGVLYVLLDCDAAADFASAHQIDVPCEGSWQDRWEHLRLQLGNAGEATEQKLLEALDGQFVEPKKLLAHFSTQPLASIIDIPPSAQQYVKDFLETLARDIEVKTDVRFQLPEPLFPNEGLDIRGLSLGLQIPSHNVERALSIIAYDGQRRLSLVDDRPAFVALQKTGVYKRGDFEISFSWYAGRDKIRLWRHRIWAETIYQLCNEAPTCIVGTDADPSLARGIFQLLVGLGVTANRLLGIVPSLLPKFSEEAIDVESSRAYFSWLENSQGFNLVGTEPASSSMERRSALMVPPGADAPRLVPYPAIYEHKSRGVLDFRTHIPAIQVRLSEILQKAKNAVEQKLGSRRMAMIASWSRTMNQEEATQKYLEAWHEAYIDEIEGRREEIDKVSRLPDLTNTVLREQKAMLIISRIRTIHRALQDSKIKEKLDAWKEENPIKATSEAFVDKQRAKLAADASREAVPIGSTCEALLEAGLDGIALLVETQEDFEASAAFATKSCELREAKEPHLQETSFLRLPSNWKVLSHEWRGRHGSKTLYEIDIYRKVSIPSSLPLWRSLVLVTRSLGWMWNANFFLANAALIGVRRWNPCRDDFGIRTGSLDANGQFAIRKLRTLRGRIAAVHRWRRDVLEAARRSEHIIRLRNNLYLDVCWAHFWTSFGVVISDVGVTATTAVESVGRIILATASIATSPIWSLMASLGFSLWNSLINDNDLPHPPSERLYDGRSRSPLSWNQFGIPNIILSVAKTIWHVAKGTVTGVFGEMHHLWNRMWHGMMTFLLKRAEVPSQPEGFFWSTAGKGMKTPFVLIHADAATMALLVFLSKEELQVATQELMEELEEPQIELKAKLAQDSAGALSLYDLSILRTAIKKPYEHSVEAFRQDSSVVSAEREYAEFLRRVQANPWVRMKREELETFLSRATLLMKKFYIERHFPRVSLAEVSQFWESRDLPPGDWAGLAESAAASAIFSPEIVVPFEAAEDDLVVEANTQCGLETIIRQALKEQGAVTGLSTEYRIGSPVDLKIIPRHPTYEGVEMRFVPVPSGEVESTEGEV